MIAQIPFFGWSRMAGLCPTRFAWRAVVAMALLATYLVLAGEAIHCQYFVSEHDQHGTSPLRSTTHTTHCILANHGAAAIPSIASLGVQSLPLVSSVRYLEHTSARGLVVASAPARAPPAV